MIKRRLTRLQKLIQEAKALIDKGARPWPSDLPMAFNKTAQHLQKWIGDYKTKLIKIIEEIEK